MVTSTAPRANSTQTRHDDEKEAVSTGLTIQCKYSMGNRINVLARIWKSENLAKKENQRCTTYCREEARTLDFLTHVSTTNTFVLYPISGLPPTGWLRWLADWRMGRFRDEEIRDAEWRDRKQPPQPPPKPWKRPAPSRQGACAGTYIVVLCTANKMSLAADRLPAPRPPPVGPAWPLEGGGGD